ncbi:hypothetical protein G6011_08103 [Alternaria panax]|uniref:SigF-like NTF2-like domain-containing protein n=1 Tax=Alternaria panax TaxID=48097 RepID=A0AAD4FHF4_9PLEO|nr:hypothetical protein G6011_08103 [Alternaria panax]
MEDPVKEIPAVIHLLTQSPPSLQRATIEKYFTPDAAFSHPFCRTWSRPNSRWLVERTYRWYKIMSPRIDCTVQSVAFDENNLILYVTLFQIFRVWLIPFYYAPVRLTTVLYLRRTPSPPSYAAIASSATSSTPTSTSATSAKPNHSLLADISASTTSKPTNGISKPLFHIAKQDDLYQVDQWIRFIAPGAWMLIWLWQAWATVFCVAGTVLLWPVTWVEENWGWGSVGVGRKGVAKVEMEMEKPGSKETEVSVDGLGEEEVLGRSGLRGRIVG